MDMKSRDGGGMSYAGEHFPVWEPQERALRLGYSEFGQNEGRVEVTHDKDREKSSCTRWCVVDWRLYSVSNAEPLIIPSR